MSDPNLVTTCNLHGQDYLVKMNVVNNYLEILISDKQTGEEWQCSYDHSCNVYYISKVDVVILYLFSF